MHNVLLSSVGRRVEMVRAFRRAYEALDIEGNIIGTDCDWLAPALQEVDIPIVVPRFSDERFIPSLLHVCERESVRAVFPFHDGELIHLSENAERIEQTGADVAVLPPPAIAICADKWKTRQFFSRLGLPQAFSWLPEEGRPQPITYPVFIKPRNGSAGENAFRVNRPEELDFFESYVPNPIVQQFLTGPEITSDVVCGMDGNVLSIVSRQRIAVRGGEAIKSTTVRDTRIELACHEIAAQLPARGPITVQCMMHEDMPYFVEINARLGGGVPLAIAAGVDVPALLLADLAGLSNLKLKDTPDLGVFMTRCDESFFLTESHCEHVNGRQSESRRLRP